MKKIAVLTSGGDAPGMNAAIRAVVRCGIASDMEVYGINQGYEGLLNGEIEKLDARSVADILHKGGTVLRTARSQRFKEDKWLDHAADLLRTYGIEGVVCIGGDGTFAGAENLAKRGIEVVGVPGTIDNDLAYTDFTIGFDTAVNTVLSAITNLRNTSSSHDRTVIIEVMGRECGDIALYAGLTGGAEYILIPEEKCDEASLTRKIIEGMNKGKLHSIIINAEGSGINSQELSQKLESLTGRETKVVNLSYLQRGGEPTMQDRLLATRMAAKAVDLLKDMEPGDRAKAVGICGGEIVAMDLADALNVEKKHEEADYYTSLIDILSR